MIEPAFIGCVAAGAFLVGDFVGYVIGKRSAKRAVSSAVAEARERWADQDAFMNAVNAYSAPSARTTARMPCMGTRNRRDEMLQSDWLAILEEPVPLASLDGRTTEPKPGDTRIVEITTVVPHLWRLDRYHDAYVRQNSQYNKEPRTIPAGWARVKVGRYSNGMFESEQEARDAAEGPRVVAYFPKEETPDVG